MFRSMLTRKERKEFVILKVQSPEYNWVYVYFWDGFDKYSNGSLTYGGCIGNYFNNLVHWCYWDDGWIMTYT